MNNNEDRPPETFQIPSFSIFSARVMQLGTRRW